MRVFLLVVLSLCISNMGYAQDPKQDIGPNVFEPAKILNRAKPEFPKRKARPWKAGYVSINFIVGKDGMASDPIVIESVGPKFFVATTLTVLDKSEWQPATLNGVPVDSARSYNHTLQLVTSTGVKRSFGRKYDKFNEYFSNKEYEKSKHLLDQMRRMQRRHDLNLHEITYLSVANFKTAKIANDAEAQLASLKLALMYAHDGKKEKHFYLPQDARPILQLERFRLEIGLKHYAEALRTHKLIKKSAVKKHIAAVKPAIKKLLALKDSEQPYSISGNINDRGLWLIGLFKKAFYLDEIQGQIEEIKLRCRAKYISFPYTAETQYTIPAAWGKCDVQIVGTPKTKFELVQLNPEI